VIPYLKSTLISTPQTRTDCFWLAVAAGIVQTWLVKACSTHPYALELVSIAFASYGINAKVAERFVAELIKQDIIPKKGSQELIKFGPTLSQALEILAYVDLPVLTTKG